MRSYEGASALQQTMFSMERTSLIYMSTQRKEYPLKMRDKRARERKYARNTENMQNFVDFFTKKGAELVKM